MSHTRVRSIRPKSRPQSGQRSNCAPNCVSAITTEANLMKLHRKIKHNEVCHTQKLSFHIQGQGHNQGHRSNNLSAIHTEASFLKFYKKVNHNAYD